MANNRESGNGTFINLFLMVSTLMFIHQGWQEIDIMTNDSRWIHRPGIDNLQFPVRKKSVITNGRTN